MHKTEIVLQTIIDALNKTGKEYDMKINVNKTKVMIISSREGGNAGHKDRWASRRAKITFVI